MGKPKLSDDGQTVTVRVPISIRKRGGRRLVLAPDGTEITTAPVCRRIDSAMIKAVARAFRWREMLENGTHATIAEIAAVEKINESYVSRVVRLTLLAPDIVEAILAGRQATNLQLEDLLQRLPVEWQAQRDGFVDRVAVNDGEPKARSTSGPGLVDESSAQQSSAFVNDMSNWSLTSRRLSCA